MHPYQILALEKQVTATSDIRIPYEPTGVAKEFRASLRDQVSKLRPEDDEILVALFQTQHTDFFDVENVLLYNLGPAIFNHVSCNGIILSSGALSPSDSACNVYRYKLVKRQDVVAELHERQRNVALDFSFALDKLNTSLSAADYWLAFHRGAATVKTDTRGDRFGVHVEIAIPGKCHHVASFVKSLVDGIISALHTENSKDLEAEARLANKLSLDVDTVASLLWRTEFAVLGERNLLSTYRNGVKWNPADERCGEIAILLHTSKEVIRPTLRGRVFWF